MKTITVDEFLNLRPCYGEKRIREIAGDKEEWTVMDILRLKNVPAKDRLWAVLRPELLDDTLVHEFACRCAERVLSKSKTPDPRSLAAIAAKRAWLRGEISDDELRRARAAARSAAWEAAYVAAGSDARAAAVSAAYAAARATAYVAARATAYAAAVSAAYAAAMKAEREWQVAELIKMLEE